MTCFPGASVSIRLPSLHSLQARLRRQGDGVRVLAHPPRHLPTRTFLPVPNILLVHILREYSGRSQILSVDARFDGVVPLSLTRARADVNFLGDASRARIRRSTTHQMPLSLAQNRRRKIPCPSIIAVEGNSARVFELFLQVSSIVLDNKIGYVAGGFDLELVSDKRVAVAFDACWGVVRNPLPRPPNEWSISGLVQFPLLIVGPFKRAVVLVCVVRCCHRV